MSIPRPILDDRSYLQLRDELVRRIPVYNPSWTDHNASDPGITLIELFAYLGENVLFRFNQLPDATRLAFLKLLDVPLRPAEPARTMLQVTNDSQLEVVVAPLTRATAGDVTFETSEELASLKLEAAGFLKQCVAAPAQNTEEAAVSDQAKDAASLRTGEGAAYYRALPFPADPKAGVVVDPACTVDGCIWVAVLAEPGEAPLIGHPSQLFGKTLNLGLLLDGTTHGLDELARADEGCATCGPVQQRPAAEKIASALPPCRGTDAPAPHDVLWHCSSGVREADGTPRYRLLSIEADTTRSLEQSGVVRLSLPASELGAFTLATPEEEGTRTLPPRLDDDELRARVLFWLRGSRRDGHPLPKLRWVGPNAVMVTQTRAGATAFLGTGTGQPRQQVKVLHAPVVPGTLVLQVESRQGRFEPWAEVSSFDASTESDLHFMVDLHSGVVTFGDGLRGAAPQLGQRIRVLRYRWGGGAAGNVAPEAINRLDLTETVKVKNVVAAWGGADAEGIETALERVPAELRRRDRAVTQSDFAELARATPGADIARAETMARFYPPLFKPETPGVVTVVVWPRVDPEHPQAPRPSRTTLDRVCAHLDQRRLITTELWVIPPSYVQLAVSIGLQVKPGFGIEGVRQWVEKVVRQYLSPLPPNGPEGAGWPLGRQVDARELVAAALQVDGVRLIEDVTLAWRADEHAAWAQVPNPPIVPLQAWQVPELVAITVVEGAALSPDETVAPVAPPRVPVPIPVLKEEC